MELYFAPLACSLATRISSYEAGADCKFHQVDTRAKRVADGSDFFAINPLGMVPAVRVDSGELLLENPAVLLWLADQHPEAKLAPKDGLARYRLIQWLSFVGTELHKLVFTPLLDSKSNDGAKAYAREKAKTRLEYLNKHLEGREFLLDRFTVADAYLTAVLNWAQFVELDLRPYPNVLAYHQRMHARQAVKKAFGEEMALFKEQQARRAAQASAAAPQPATAAAT
jgi:glutathione S-transferase